MSGLRRRDVLRGTLHGLVVAAATTLPSCDTVHKCVGVPLWRPVDGQLIPTTASYFNTPNAVKKYDDELADLFNENWIKEFGVYANKHLCITYGNVPDGAQGMNINKRRFSWSRFRFQEMDYILAGQKSEPFKNLTNLGHETGHELHKHGEYIPILTAYRIGTKPNVHNPQFGYDTLCTSFAVAHTEMLNEIQNLEFEKNQYTRGSLAAMLALNQNSGDFAKAHSALISSPGLYLGEADRRFNNIFGRPDEQGVTIVETDGTQRQSPLLYTIVAFYDFWNKVGHQVITHNVDQNPALTPATKTTLRQCMRQAARFPTHSLYATVQNPTPKITTLRTYYKEGFVNPLVMLEPPGYNYEIPKGL